MNSYRIVVKKTTEFSDKDWKEYVHAFNTIFEKDFNIQHFKDKYAMTSIGFSSHGILYFKKNIVGMFTVIPRAYKYKDKIEDIGLACDAFILEDHRKDESFLKKMALDVFNHLSQFNVNRFISIPNQVAYPYWKYFVKWRDIDYLDYYILPVKITKFINNKFIFLDFFSAILFKSLVFLFSLKNELVNRNIEKKNITLFRDEKYYKQRFDNNYKVITLSEEFTFAFRVYDEDGIKVAYLIDCDPLSKTHLSKALNYIVNKSKLKVDCVMFIGIIDSPPMYFFKVPKKREPRKQPFIGFSFNKNDDVFFDIKSWEVSLANFDNR